MDALGIGEHAVVLRPMSETDQAGDEGFAGVGTELLVAVEQQRRNLLRKRPDRPNGLRFRRIARRRLYNAISFVCNSRQKGDERT